MPAIKIEIDKKTWEVRIEAEGYTGGKCVHDVDELQRILGMGTTEQKLKPEYQKRVTVGKVGA